MLHRSLTYSHLAVLHVLHLAVPHAMKKRIAFTHCSHRLLEKLEKVPGCSRGNVRNFDEASRRRAGRRGWKLACHISITACQSFDPGDDRPLSPSPAGDKGQMLACVIWVE